MRVRGRTRLAKFARKHAQAKKALDAWYEEAIKAIWNTPHDIRALYNSADFLSGNRVIFNIKGNHYRLVSELDYENGTIAIQGVYTHAEYDKQTFS